MSRIEEKSKEFRDKLIVKNDHGSDNEYSVSHPDAISDGDNYGKQSEGSAADIAMRKKLTVKNKYNSDKEYNQSNA